MTLLEICVDDADGLKTAIAGGADRIELCSVLELGGLTPFPGLVALAAQTDMPVRAMIRPRAGDFVFSPDDVLAMKADIAAIRSAGLEGVVLGASRADGQLDIEMLRELVAAAAGLRLTLHRAIDLVPDLARAVEQAIDLGFDTILTSGRAIKALDGVVDLALAHRIAGGRITIMAGSGISAETAGPLLDDVPLSAVHGACADPVAQDSAPAIRLGFGSPGRKATSLAKVSALRALLTARGKSSA